MNEIWKDVKGYEGYYKVSNLGRVKSSVRPYQTRERILKDTISKYGYVRYCLSKDCKTKNHFGHRLVAEAFIPNHNNKTHINHINGKKTDNNINNLEWCTPKENTIHAVRTGLLKCSTTKLSKKDVLDIRKLKKFFTNKELSIIFDISYDTAKGITKGKLCKYVKGGFYE